MAGVDQHDHLWSSFSLGKAHKIKKYYIKLLLFVMDVALTNSWVYYSLANPDDVNKDGAILIGNQSIKTIVGNHLVQRLT
jgi:hypothetical protein